MPIGVGHVGIGKETTFGTAATVGTFLPVKSVELNTDPQVYYPEEIRNSRSKAKGIPMGQKHEGSLEMDVESVSIGHLLLGALGEVSTTGTGPYVHTFEPGNTLPSFTLEKYDTIMSQVVAGLKMDKLSLSVEAGGDGVMTAEVDLKAQSVTDGTASTPNYTDKSPFAFHQVTVTKGGSANEDIRSVSLEIANNLKDDQYTLRASKDVSSINEGMREVTGSVEMFFKTKADYLAFMNGTEDSLSLSFAAGADQLVVELPKISYDSFEVPMGGADDEIMASLEFTALLDAAKGYEIKAELTNSVASY